MPGAASSCGAGGGGGLVIARAIDTVVTDCVDSGDSAKDSVAGSGKINVFLLVVEVIVVVVLGLIGVAVMILQ